MQCCACLKEEELISTVYAQKTYCACAETKLVLTTVYCTYMYYTVYNTALCSYRLLYTVRMRRNEVGAHYSTVYYSSNYLQYCSLFLQITVHSAHAQKRSWCSFQCTVLYTSIIQYCSLFLQLSVLCACAERKEVFSLQV